MMFQEKGLIFVHIQKTGGDAVRAALSGQLNPPEKHFFAIELRDLYGADAWRSHYTFAFVRNPWDRLVSWWSMIDAMRADFARGAPLNQFQTFVLRNARTFEEFLENCDEEIVDSDGRKWIYRNQLDYVTDSSGRQIVDFVGRFETLAEDFRFVTMKVLGATIALPHLNAAPRRRYAAYFTPALAKKVEHRYARDIDAFGYRFAGSQALCE